MSSHVVIETKSKGKLAAIWTKHTVTYLGE